MAESHRPERSGRMTRGLTDDILTLWLTRVLPAT